jgi:hypothetical protein
MSFERMGLKSKSSVSASSSDASTLSPTQTSSVTPLDCRPPPLGRSQRDQQTDDSRSVPSQHRKMMMIHLKVKIITPLIVYVAASGVGVNKTIDIDMEQEARRRSIPYASHMPSLYSLPLQSGQHDPRLVASQANEGPSTSSAPLLFPMPPPLQHT